MKTLSSIFVIPVFLLSVIVSTAQVSVQWSSRFSGTANDTDVVKAIAGDSFGNLYITGYSTSSGTGKDFATIKYDPFGNQIWVAFYNNDAVNAEDVATGICVDVLGNVYVTGFSMGEGTFLDYATIKYSSSGQQLWIARYNGTGNDDDVSSSIRNDRLGNVYVSGYSVGAGTSEDYATLKYNSAGVLQWTAIYDFAGDIDIANDMCFDNSGNIVVTGFCTGNGTQEDYATVKYNSQGDEIWSSRFNGLGNGYDIAQSVAADNYGNVFVTGFSLGKVTEEDYATLKYDQDGNQSWVKFYNDASNRYDIATSIAVDNSGNSYVTGYSFNDATSEDYNTLKYSPDGTQLWSVEYNGEGNGYDITSALKLDSLNNVYVTGYSYRNGTEEDIATVKYNSNGIFQWEEIYNGLSDGTDISTSLDVDASGNVYVAGYSDIGSGNFDYVTVKYNQTVGINSVTGSIPTSCILSQNYPNPFNPVTKIRFDILPVSNRSSYQALLVVYNSLGEKVRTLVNKRLAAGSYEAEFNGIDMPGGIYFYRLTYGTFSDTKKMILIK